MRGSGDEGGMLARPACFLFVSASHCARLNEKSLCCFMFLFSDQQPRFIYFFKSSNAIFFSCICIWCMSKYVGVTESFNLGILEKTSAFPKITYRSLFTCQIFNIVTDLSSRRSSVSQVFIFYRSGCIYKHICNSISIFIIPHDYM